MRDDLHNRPVTDKPTMLSKIADWTIVALALAGVVVLVGGLFGLFGCHPSLISITPAAETPIPGITGTTPTPESDPWGAVWVAAGGLLYPLVIRPLRLWLANRKEPKP